MADTLLLEGMRFFGYHGVFPEETALGQRFVVDVYMELDLRDAGATDELNATVDYFAVYEVVRSIVEGEPRKLVETVVDECARTVLRDFPMIDAVEVTMRKPGAPIKAAAIDAVGAKVRRVRAHVEATQSVEVPMPPYLTKGRGSTL